MNSQSRLLSVLTSLLLASSLFVLMGCPNPSKPPGPILDLRFDGNLKDSSVNHHDATAHGPIHYGMDRFGHPGKALVLDGDSYLTVPNTPDLNFSDTASFTISVWVRTKDTSDVAVLQKGPVNSALPGYKLGMKNGRVYASLTARDSNVNLRGLTSIADDHWHLLTLACAPHHVDLYVDTNHVAQRSGVTLKTDSLNSSGIIIRKLGGSKPQPRMLIDRAMIVIGWLPPIMNVPIFATEHPPGDFGSTGDTIVLGVAWANVDTGVCCGTWGYLSWTTDGGGSWQRVTTGVEDCLRRVSLFQSKPGQPIYAAVVGDNGQLWVSTIGNLGSWQQRSIPIVPLGGIASINIHDVKYVGGSQLLVAGAVPITATTWQGFVCYSSNNGADWSVVASPTNQWFWDNPVYCLALNALTPQLYAGAYGGLFKISSGTPTPTPPSTGTSYLIAPWTATNVGPDVTTNPATAQISSTESIAAFDFDGGTAVAVSDLGNEYEISTSTFTKITPSSIPANTSLYGVQLLSGVSAIVGANDIKLSGGQTINVSTAPPPTPTWIYIAKRGTSKMTLLSSTATQAWGNIYSSTP